MDSNQNAVQNALVGEVLDAQRGEKDSATPSPQQVQQQMGLSPQTHLLSHHQDTLLQPGTRQTTSTPQSQVPSRKDLIAAEFDALIRQRMWEEFGSKGIMPNAMTAPVPQVGRSTPAYQNVYGLPAMPSSTSAPTQPAFDLHVRQSQFGPSAMASPSSMPAPLPVAQSPFVLPVGQLLSLLRMPQPQFNPAVPQPSFSLPVPQPQSAATTELTTEINQLIQLKIMKLEAEINKLSNENGTLVNEKEDMRSQLRDFETLFVDMENREEEVEWALETKEKDFRKLTKESAKKEIELKEQLENNCDEYKRELEKKNRYISSLETKNRDLEGSKLDFQEKYAKLQKGDESRIQLHTNFSDFAKDFQEKIISAIPSSHQVPLRSGKRASSPQIYSLGPGNNKACRDDGEEDEEH